MVTYIWQARLQSAWAARHTVHTQRIPNAHTQRKHTQSPFGHVLDMESMSKHSGVLLKLHTQTSTHAEGKEMWFQARKYVQLFRSDMVSLKSIYSWLCRQNKQFLCILMLKMSAFYNILYPSSSSHGNHSSAQDNDGCAIGMQFLSTNFLVLAFHCLVCLLSLCFRGASSHSSAPSVHP